ncbi:MAG: hypothetical protein AAFQ11_07550, partial [Pseudomonadota bacterium]
TFAACWGLALTTPAAAESSSWRMRSPDARPSERPRASRGATQQRRSTPQIRSTLPAATGPIPPTAETRDPLQSALAPPARLRRPLGPTSSIPTGENAAYIAYEQGLYLTSLRLAKAQAKAGRPGAAQAHTLIGRIYQEGLGVSVNLGRAVQSYEAADQLGDPEGTFALALLHVGGTGVKKDPDIAALLFEKAARTGHAFANYNLALSFLSGRGKPENPRRAALHLAYAAKQNIARAQYDLATLYDTGHGVDTDAYKAALWLRRAADNGLTIAQYEYAVLLLQGRGLNEDRPRTVEYLKSAALKGIPGAQNRLSYLYFDGKLVPKDLERAAKWRLIAEASGFKDKALDKALMSLPSDLVARAKAEATGFLQQAALGRASLTAPNR